MVQRRLQRLKCDIETLACTTIEVRPARIVDLSRGGAKVQLEKPFAVGTNIHLDVEGDYYWATVMWSEIDRMGLKFRAPVATGILETLLNQLQIAAMQPERRVQGFGRRKVA